MSVFRANFDYEYELFDINAPKIRSNLNSELEYLALITSGGEKFLSNQTYSQAYRDSLSDYGLNFRDLDDVSQETKTWWGKLENIDIERRINKKDFVIELENNFPLKTLNTKSVTCLEEIELNENKSYLFKSNHLMSGRGQYQSTGQNFGPNKIKPLLKNGAICIQDYKKVLIDFHVFFDAGELSFYLGKSSKQRQFQELIFTHDFSILKNFLKGCDLEGNEVLLKSIIEYILELAPGYCGSVDGIIYKEDNCLYYSVTEVNLRKTMGYILLNLCAQLGLDQAILRPANFPAHFKSINLAPSQSQFPLKIEIPESGHQLMSYLSSL